MKISSRHFIASAIAAVLTITNAPDVLAIKAKPGTTSVTMADGSQRELTIVGDEHFHYYLSESGEPMIMSGDSLKAVTADNLGMVSDERRQRLRPTPAILTSDGESTASAPKRYGLFPYANFPTTGEQKSLVILVQYNNLDFITPDPFEHFNRLLNEEGFSDNGATGSARDYFVENSNGKFLPEFDVYGPVTLSQSMSYYGGNDSWGNDKRPHEMVIEACRLLDDEIDFTQYDRNGDGIIDNVFIFYAGRGEATGGGANTIWPHSASLTDWAVDPPVTLDGVKLDSYGCTNEWESKHPCNIGTFCHEFAHILGLPDLYATSYTTAFTPGDWSMLDSGPYNNDGMTPPAMSVFERYALGWNDPLVINAPVDDTVTLQAITAGGDGAIIRCDDEGEFFLLENRRQEGWDQYIPGHGMLIWHVDYVDRVWNENIVNNKSTHQYVDLEEADNKRTASTRDGDSFPGAAGITEFSDFTSPGMVTWDGRKMGLALTDITETDDGLITFRVVASSDPDDDNNDDNNPVEDPASVGVANADAAHLSIAVAGRLITVESPEAAEIRLINASGVTLQRIRSTSAQFTVAHPGLYLITTPLASKKIAVK